MEQLLLHLMGDYITQSHWMATEKTKNSLAAWIHATVYAVPFLLIAQLDAWMVIWITHFLIDRFRIARYVVYLKNQMGPKHIRWEDCKGTGYPSDVPAWLSVWLLIAADNVMHLVINYSAIRWVQ